MLPKNVSPVYELTLPISKQKIKFVPFRVKEQKVLLMVRESAGDRDFLISNIKQILQNCIVNDVKVDNLPILDIEYYFINLRARSVNEIVQAKYLCNILVKKERTNIDDEIEVYEEACGNIMPLNINLMDIKVDVSGYKDIVPLTDKIGIKFKYPDIEYIDKIQQIGLSSEITFDIIYNCVDYIYDEDNVYYANEVPRQELIDFFDTLSLKQFNLIEEYFKNLPKLSKDYVVKCSECGHEHNIHVEGVEDFFG